MERYAIRLVCLNLTYAKRIRMPSDHHSYLTRLEDAMPGLRRIEHCIALHHRPRRDRRLERGKGLRSDCSDLPRLGCGKNCMNCGHLRHRPDMPIMRHEIHFEDRRRPRPLHEPIDGKRRMTHLIRHREDPRRRRESPILLGKARGRPQKAITLKFQLADKGMIGHGRNLVGPNLLQAMTEWRNDARYESTRPFSHAAGAQEK